jgi:lipopolysaccharide biosynthesis protein
MTLLGLGCYKELPLKVPSPLLVLFAHYDPQNVVDPYVTYYLRALKEELDATIIFMSGCATLTPESVADIAPLCAGIYARRGMSYGFGAWTHGYNIATFAWGMPFRRVVLANDSVYGPLFPLKNMWDTFRGADMYGAIESKEQTAHLQSFFLAFDTQDYRLAPGVLKRFFQAYYDIDDKDEVIRRYELGLSTAAVDRHMTLKAYVTADAARHAYRLYQNHQWKSWFDGPPLNNTLYFYDGLIDHFNFPFLKTVLPRRNRPWHDSMKHIEEFLADRCDYPYKLIEQNCARLKCGPGLWTPDWAPKNGYG